MGARRRRRIIGIIPRAGRAVWAAGRWALTHPGPFLFLTAMVAGAWLLWGYVRRAEVFHIAQVDLPADSSLHVRRPLIGDHLLTVDLRMLADELRRQQPSLKEVRVIRRLPDTLVIEPIPRVPVAQARIGPATRSPGGGTGRWHPVDADGFILPDGSVEPAEGLVRLVGFERGGSALSVGKEQKDERVRLALRVLAALQRTGSLIARRLAEVDVSDPQQIRFLIDGGATEVRCGSEAELGAHLARLEAALRAIDRQPFEVGYIDVRFQEPVIHPRT